GSTRLRIVLDPANLFERASADEARAIVAEAVERTAGHIALAHAKDRFADGRFATAGQGIVDFADFIARLKAAGFDGPLVTHGLSAGDAPGVARFLKELV
ncbi:sugar phosphate isomerase/epimerase, partial [Mesorhizobium sp. M2D.F.Ca.ET.160.01.1.1]